MEETKQQMASLQKQLNRTNAQLSVLQGEVDDEHKTQAEELSACHLALGNAENIMADALNFRASLEQQEQALEDEKASALCDNAAQFKCDRYARVVQSLNSAISDNTATIAILQASIKNETLAVTFTLAAIDEEHEQQAKIEGQIRDTQHKTITLKEGKAHESEVSARIAQLKSNKTASDATIAVLDEQQAKLNESLQSTHELSVADRLWNAAKSDAKHAQNWLHNNVVGMS